MKWGDVSNVCAKLEPASSKNNKMQEISALQKFASHVLYKTLAKGVPDLIWDYGKIFHRVLQNAQNIDRNKYHGNLTVQQQ